MIYFFHHYELPAILHQARIQQLLHQHQMQPQPEPRAGPERANTDEENLPFSDAPQPTAQANVNDDPHTPRMPPAPEDAEPPVARDAWNLEEADEEEEGTIVDSVDPIPEVQGEAEASSANSECRNRTSIAHDNLGAPGLQRGVGAGNKDSEPRAPVKDSKETSARGSEAGSSVGSGQSRTLLPRTVLGRLLTRTLPRSGEGSVRDSGAEVQSNTSPVANPEKGSMAASSTQPESPHDRQLSSVQTAAGALSGLQQEPAVHNKSSFCDKDTNKLQPGELSNGLSVTSTQELGDQYGQLESTLTPPRGEEHHTHPRENGL